MRRAARTLTLWGPPVALMAVIFALSAMPSEAEDRGVIVLIARKLGHFTEYALLFALWWRALRTRLAVRVAIGAAFAVTVAYAATDELHQRYVDGRVGTPVDVLLDTAGAATAAGLVLRRAEVARA